MPQSLPGTLGAEKNMPRDDPARMNQAEQQSQALQQARRSRKQQTSHGKTLHREIERQQQARCLPATLEGRIIWAGHGRESCEPCDADPRRRVRNAP